MSTSATPGAIRELLLDSARCQCNLQSSSPLHFRSRLLAFVAMRLALASLTLTLGICYGLWNQRGCLTFLPFISDLGLQGGMKVVFMSGLCLTSLLMAYALPHVVAARHHLLVQLRSRGGWLLLNGMLAIAVAGVVIGIAALGFFPWDQDLIGHLIATGIIFGGGSTWIAGSWLLSYHLRRQQKRKGHAWECSPISRGLQLPMLIVIMLNFAFAGVSFFCAWKEDPKALEPKGLESMLHLAQSDFQAYCTGREGWHGLTGVNFVAFAEWLLVVFLLMGVVAGFADVETYANCQAKMLGSVQQPTGDSSAGVRCPAVQKLALDSPVEDSPAGVQKLDEESPASPARS